MLNRRMVINNLNIKPESLYIARYKGVIINSIHSQAFLFGGNMIRRRRKKNVIPLCACGCGEKVKWNLNYNNWNQYLHGHQNRGRIPYNYGENKYTEEKAKPAPLCACECGKRTKWNRDNKEWSRYIHGHQNRGKSKYAKEKAKPTPLCACGCGEKVKWGGNKWYRFIAGHQARGKNNSRWKKGFFIDKRGSKVINIPNRGSVAEARLIAEKVLGRRLKSHEVVHHIDLDPSNNSNDNLLICNKVYHLFLHHRINPKAYNRKPVIVNGIKYPSITVAGEKTEYTPYFIQKRIAQNIKGYAYLK